MTEVTKRPVADDDRCGEAPLWDPRDGRLIWADIGASVVYAYRPGDTTKAVVSRGLPVSGIALNSGDGFVFAGATGLHLWRGEGNYRTILSEHDREKLVFNDIIADGKGRIYAGTLYWGANGMEKTDKLYLINSSGSLRV